RAPPALPPLPYTTLFRSGAGVFAVDLSPSGRTGAALIGATPELLVARRGETVTLRPLAGSMPRLADQQADAAQAAGLLASAKNRDRKSTRLNSSHVKISY